MLPPTEHVSAVDSLPSDAGPPARNGPPLASPAPAYAAGPSSRAGEMRLCRGTSRVEFEEVRERLAGYAEALAAAMRLANDLTLSVVAAAEASAVAEDRAITYWAAAKMYRRLAADAGDPRPPPPPPEPYAASAWAAAIGTNVRPPEMGELARRELPRQRPRRLPLRAALVALQTVQRRRCELATGLAAAIADLRAALAAEAEAMAANPSAPPGGDAHYLVARDAWVRATTYAAQLGDLVPDFVRQWRIFVLANI